MHIKYLMEMHELLGHLSESVSGKINQTRIGKCGSLKVDTKICSVMKLNIENILSMCKILSIFKKGHHPKLSLSDSLAVSKGNNMHLSAPLTLTD